ncbi:MAG TPA: hypothetical protein VFE62_22710 [Gemmataceae bacterium]|nr:hypothetical protein [Gemmataceae bacterium]
MKKDTLRLIAESMLAHSDLAAAIRTLQDGCESETLACVDLALRDIIVAARKATSAIKAEQKRTPAPQFPSESTLPFAPYVGPEIDGS